MLAKKPLICIQSISGNGWRREMAGGSCERSGSAA